LCTIYYLKRLHKSSSENSRYTNELSKILEELPAGEEEYPGNSREQENLLNQKDSVKIPGWERISWKTPGFPARKSLVCDIPAGSRKMDRDFFYSAVGK
jgi:hypothetical protein